MKKDYDFARPVRLWPGLNQYEPRLFSMMRRDKSKLGRPANFVPVGGQSMTLAGTPVNPAPTWLVRAAKK